jgi:hypothetical protein
LLGALAQHALLTGARDAALRTAVTLGAGHLTIRVEPNAASRIIRDSDAFYTNPALMRGGGAMVGRLELSVTAISAWKSAAVELVGLEDADDPQALLLAKYVVVGAWPGEKAAEAAAPKEPPPVPKSGLAPTGTPVKGTPTKSAQSKNTAPKSPAYKSVVPPKDAVPKGSVALKGIPAPIVLGEGLGEQLRVGVGDTVLIRRKEGRAERSWRARVAAIVHTGYRRADESRVWAPASAARELLPISRGAREEAVTHLAIYLDEPERTVDWLTAVKRYPLPPGVEILAWRQADPAALPAELWARALQRTERFGLIAAAGGAALAALLAVGLLWLRPQAAPAARRASQGTQGAGPRFAETVRLAWPLAAPALAGLTAGVLLFAALWSRTGSDPLEAARAFAWLGRELNPHGALVGTVSLRLGVAPALGWLGISVAVYAALTGGLAWVAARMRR